MKSYSPTRLSHDPSRAHSDRVKPSAHRLPYPEQSGRFDLERHRYEDKTKREHALAEVLAAREACQFWLRVGVLGLNPSMHCRGLELLQPSVGIRYRYPMVDVRLRSRRGQGRSAYDRVRLQWGCAACSDEQADRELTDGGQMAVAHGVDSHSEDRILAGRTDLLPGQAAALGRPLIVPYQRDRFGHS